MELIERDIGRWNDKKPVKIQDHTINGSYLLCTIDDIRLKVTCPKTETDFYMIESLTLVDASDNRWLDDINMYSLTERPTFLKLINKIVSCEKRKVNIKPTKQTIVFDDSQNEDDDAIEQFDYDFYKLSKDHEKYLDTSFSPFTSEKNSKIAQIFNKKTVGKIVLQEYLELIKTYKGSRNVSIELVDNNIFHWKLKYKSFSNEKLNTSLTLLNSAYNYDYIDVELIFHDTLYPNYPPIIKVIRPRLADALMHRIANMKMVRLDYWNATRPAKFIVQKLQTVFNKFANVLDVDMNDPNKYPFGAYLEIEANLMKLASFIDMQQEDSLDTEEYQKVSTDPVQQKVTKTATKTTIKRAIKEIYKVAPMRVNIVKLGAKTVVVKGKKGSTKAVVKAYVYLKKGDKIDLA